MKLRFTPRAIENIDAVSDYLHARNPAAAEHVVADIYGCLERLLLFPRAGHLQHVSGVRKLASPKYSYLIYYTLDEATDEIIVLNVKHPRQRREYSDI
jgi:plasmid stabilization system protein ParE